MKFITGPLLMFIWCHRMHFTIVDYDR